MNDNKSTQVNLVLNIILLIAVVILFILYFAKDSDKNIASSPKQEKAKVASSIKTVDNEDTSTVGFEVKMPAHFTVAYVNTDSLWAQYKFVQDALTKLQNTESQMKARLQSKAKKLQDDYEKYVRQGKAGLLTLQQQKDTEARLTKQQQEGVQMEQNLQGQLMAHKQEVNNQLTDTILSFLNSYRMEHHYTLILQYGYSSGLLSASPKLDITKDVIKRLNAKYDFDKSHQ